MGEGMAVGHHLAMEEHRRNEHHVRRVGDAPLGQVRVVVPVQVAGTHRLHRVVVPHAAQDVAAHGVAVDFPAAGVQEAHGVVLLLPNERRHRRALDYQLALQPRGPQRAADQLPRNGIDRLDEFTLWRVGFGVALADCHFTLRLARMMQLPYRSMRDSQPGLITTVESMPSRMAGPDDARLRAQSLPAVDGALHEIPRLIEVHRAPVNHGIGSDRPAPGGSVGMATSPR